LFLFFPLFKMKIIYFFHKDPVGFYIVLYVSNNFFNFIIFIILN
jgi:hypothetical protein